MIITGAPPGQGIEHEPTRFMWSKTAEQILDSLGRVLKRTTAAGQFNQTTIDLLLESPLPVIPAQRPTLSVAGDRQLPAIQAGLAAEGEVLRQARGEIHLHGSEAGVCGQVDLLVGIGVEVIQLLGP